MLRLGDLLFGGSRRMGKRGISIIIAYIILVSIGLALSAMVYSWLVFYIPTADDVNICPEGLSLSIRDVRCDSQNRVLNFSVKNTGLFSADGISIKVNDDVFSTIGIFLVGENFTKISPGKEVFYSYDYFNLVNNNPLKSDLKLLELQPFFNALDGNILPCQPTVKESITCSSFEVESDSSLLLYYTFDANLGCGVGGLEVCDDSLYDAYGTVSGATYNLGGGYDGIGGGYSFDGVDNYIGLSSEDDADVTGDITVSAWVYVDPSITNDVVVLQKYRQYSLIIDEFKKVSWADSSAWSWSTFGYYDIGLSFDDWEYISVTKKADNVTIYLNGEQKFSQLSGGVITHTTNVTYIGCNGDKLGPCGGNFFKGDIDEVKIYDRALTNIEIKTLFNSY